jgi:hypothetical protein
LQKYRRPPKPEEIWDGKFPPAQPWRSALKAQGLSANFSGGDGSITTPWLISTPWDLAQIASDVADGNSHLGDYFKLTCDIYLNYAEIIPANVDPTTQGVEGYDNEGDIPIYEWKPIGGAGNGYVDEDEEEHAYGFEGNFDGNGKTIFNAFYNSQNPTVGKGLYPENQVGIFGDIYSSASIKDLKTEGGYIGGNISVGGIVGRTWGGSITNCHNGNFVYGIGSQGAGGVTGTSWVFIPKPNSGGVITTPAIDRCSNSATVISNYVKSGNVGSGSGGGIVGENEGTVINSWNEGLVSCLRNAGGIVGSNQNSSGGDPVIYVDPAYINNCYNTGNIGSFAGEGNIPDGEAQIAGGIMGYQTGSCQNVYNIGNITALPGADNGAGQIIGELNTDASQTNNWLFYYSEVTPNVPVGIPANWEPDADPAIVEQFNDDAELPDFEDELLLDMLNLWVDDDIADDGNSYSAWNRVKWPRFESGILKMLRNRK